MTPGEPMPSLLRSLLSEHLDAGYAAAAGRPGRSRKGWQVLAALLIAAVSAAAVTHARSSAPDVDAAREALAESVHGTQDRNRSLAAERTALAAQVDEIQRRQLAADVDGRALLGGLDAAALSGASTAVVGPGLVVTVTDPGTGRTLTDVSTQPAGPRQVILDRDLQLVVNALWAGGAEAVSVGGIRIGPDVTVRRGGGAILVDNQPIASPYEVMAIGTDQAAVANAQARLAALSILIGTVAATGPGIRITVTDPGPGVAPETMLDVINELRAAGAETIQINSGAQDGAGAQSVRVGVDTSVLGEPGALVIDTVSLRPPYFLLAIGDPPTLAAAMTIPGGAVDGVKRVGGAMTVEQSDLIEVPTLRQPKVRQYAQPVK